MKAPDLTVLLCLTLTLANTWNSSLVLVRHFKSAMKDRIHSAVFYWPKKYPLDCLFACYVVLEIKCLESKTEIQLRTYQKFAPPLD